MSTAEPGSGDGPDDAPPIWEDVTEHQPERDVPPAVDPLAVPPPGPGAPAPAEPVAGPPPFGQPGQPTAPPQPAGPVFVNPGALPPEQAAQFVRSDGTPVGQPTGPFNPGTPTFVPHDGQPQPGAPVFTQPGSQQRQSGAPVFTQSGPPPGIQPHAGGPVFVPPGGAGPGLPGIPGGGQPMFVQPPPQASPVDEERPWRWWLGPVAVIAAIFGIVPAQLGLAAIIGAIQGGNFEDIVKDYAHWFGILQDVCWIAIVVLLPFMVVKYLRPAQLGLRKPPRPWLAVGVFFGALFAFYFFSAIYSLALGLEDTDNTMLQDTGFGDSVLKDVVFALLFTVAAPVAEELLFRGLLFRTLRDGLTKAWGKNGGLIGGALISGLIFGGVHLGGGQDSFLPVLMALGVILALAYHWSGTLYVPIALHALNNAVATGFNSDPSSDLVFVVIGLGPVLAVATAYGIGKAVGRIFPAEPRDPARMAPEEHATL